MITRVSRFGPLGIALLTILFAGGAGRPQNSRIPNAQSTTGDVLPGFGADVPASVKERQVKLQNEERQRRLVDDTQKLLTLATQLHEDVSKTDKNILSIDVVRRADEIEKLAHAVKDRMRG